MNEVNATPHAELIAELMNPNIPKNEREHAAVREIERLRETRQAIIAGALFDFMAWLTSRKERLVLSGADEASPAVDAIRDFAKMRGLSLDDARVQDWQEALAAPVQEPLTDLADEVIGCFHAAEIEGLTEALANTTDEHLKDLVERRLMYALYSAQETKKEPE